LQMIAYYYLFIHQTDHLFLRRTTTESQVRSKHKRTSLESTSQVSATHRKQYSMLRAFGSQALAFRDSAETTSWPQQPIHSTHADGPVSTEISDLRNF